MKHACALLLTVLLLFACKKVEIREIKVEVPVEKKTSWTEIKRFEGTHRIFLSSGRSTDAIYLQQPFYFTELRNQDIYSGITVYGASLPTDVNVKIPIGKNFYAMPYRYSEATLRVVNNKQPVTYTTGGFYELRKMDSSAVRIKTDYLTLFQSMTISNNDALLLAYDNNRPGYPYTFLLLKMKTMRDYPFIDTVYSRTVVIPRTETTGTYIRHIKAVKDYFLVDLSGEGIFKIREDGSFKKVHRTMIVDAFYEWKGKVYAHAEWEKVLISEDEGENWQQYSGTNNAMTLATYHVVKDSLVGAYRDHLFTLRWDGPNYSMRLLKNDGLENTAISGVEVLRDSVYVATTSGLYTKSVKEFFDSK